MNNTSEKTRILLMVIMILVNSFYACRREKMEDKPKWRAIIAFSDTDSVSEDWNWIYSDIQTACQDKDIFVIYAGPENKHIPIGPKEEPLSIIDISMYYKYGNGYIFAESGREMKYQEYSLSNKILESASEYFGISLTPD
jgi:hypothetical protein